MDGLAQSFGPIFEGSAGAYIPEVLYVRQGDKVWFACGNKTLTESVEANGTVVESMDQLELEEREGKKYVKNGRWYVEGTYQRSDVENANKRKYPRKLWERIIANPKSPFMQNVKAGSVVGHIEHPGDGRTDGTKVALKHVDFRLENDGRVWGRSMITSNTPGRELQALTEDRVRWGVSSRGSGSIAADGTVSEADFQLETFDMVMRPSTPGAYPMLTPAKGKTVSEEEEDDDAVSLNEGDVDQITRTKKQLSKGLSGWVKDYHADKKAGNETHKSIKKNIDAEIKKHKLHAPTVYAEDTRYNDATSLDEAAQNPFHKAIKSYGFRTHESPIAGDTKEHYTRGDPNDKKLTHFISVAKDGDGKQWKWKHSMQRKDGQYVHGKEGLDHAELDKRMHGMGLKKKVKESDLSYDAEECVTEATTLSNTDVTNLDESEATAIAARMLKTLGTVNSLSRSKDLSPDTSADLRDWLTGKLTEIYHRVPKKAPSTVTESDSGDSRNAQYERVVSDLRQQVTEANEEANRQSELVDSLTTRATEAEAEALRVQKLLKESVKRAAQTGQALSELTRKYETALATIEELTADNVSNPVEAAVNEAIEQNPTLESFRSLLVKADSIEEVFAHAASLAKSANGDKGTGRARAPAIRSTLPRGIVESTTVVGPNNTKTVSVSRGAKVAGAVMARMSTSPKP